MLQARTLQNLSADGLVNWQCHGFRLDETTLLRLIAASLPLLLFAKVRAYVAQPERFL
jgi:hypothetical protein